MVVIKEINITTMSKKEKMAVTQEISVLSRLSVRLSPAHVATPHLPAPTPSTHRHLPTTRPAQPPTPPRRPRVQCPNIVAYFDAFQERGSLCIVMEYADGGR
jgi:serine/threonine protein kinase